MTDIVERAEKFVALDHQVTNFVGSVPIINDLVTEVKRLRWQVKNQQRPQPVPKHICTEMYCCD